MRERRGRVPKTLLAAFTACAAGSFAVAAAQGQPASPPPAGSIAPSIPLVVQRTPEASDCMDASAIADRVTLLTGRRALVAAESAGDSFTYEVQIRKSEDGYTAVVRAGDKSRQIADPGPTCASLSEALSLTLAILVDADEPPPPAPTASASASASASTASEPPAPVRIFVPPPRPPPPRAAPRLLLSPSVGLSEGLSGSLVPAVVLLNDLLLIGPVSLLAGFTWMPSQDFPLGPGRVEVQLMYGQLGGCASTWSFLGSARLGGCLQLNVGGLRGKAIGYADSREVVRPWTSFGLTALLDVPVVGPLYWSTRLSGFVNAPQEAFAIDGVGVAFDPPPVGVLVATGASVRIF
ncbi:MAG: hypothetical protein R3B70_28580 [Polyangiaceae bacterium]